MKIKIRQPKLNQKASVALMDFVHLPEVGVNDCCTMLFPKDTYCAVSGPNVF